MNNFGFNFLNNNNQIPQNIPQNIPRFESDNNMQNIKISVNVKVFSFKDNFGLIFYDSISEYPGYLFFNSSIIINENNIDNKNIIIKLFEDSSNTNFIFSDYIKLLNNIFSLKYKIKINNYTNESISGVKIKLGPSEINISDIINFNQQITFESNINGAIPGEYFMEFSILFEVICFVFLD